jgi:hypothetical protein
VLVLVIDGPVVLCNKKRSRATIWKMRGRQRPARKFSGPSVPSHTVRVAVRIASVILKLQPSKESHHSRCKSHPSQLPIMRHEFSLGRIFHHAFQDRRDLSASMAAHRTRCQLAGEFHEQLFARFASSSGSAAAGSMDGHVPRCNHFLESPTLSPSCWPSLRRHHDTSRARETGCRMHKSPWSRKILSGFRPSQPGCLGEGPSSGTHSLVGRLSRHLLFVALTRCPTYYCQSIYGCIYRSSIRTSANLVWRIDCKQMCVMVTWCPVVARCVVASTR